MCAELACSVLSRGLQGTGGLLSLLTYIAADVCHVLVVCCILKGVVALAERLSSQAVSRKAKWVARCFIAARAVMVTEAIVREIVSLTGPHGVDTYYVAEIAASLLGWVGFVLNIIALVTYIKALSSAQKMLAGE